MGGIRAKQYKIFNAATRSKKKSKKQNTISKEEGISRCVGRGDLCRRSRHLSSGAVRHVILRQWHDSCKAFLSPRRFVRRGTPGRLVKVCRNRLRCTELAIEILSQTSPHFASSHRGSSSATAVGGN